MNYDVQSFLPIFVDVIVFVSQGFLTIFIEIVFCRIFYEIFFVESNRYRKCKIPLLFLLGGFIYAISNLFIEYFLLKEFLIAFAIAGVMKFFNEYSFIRNLILSVIFLSLDVVADYLSIVIYSGLGKEESSLLQTALLVMLSKVVLFLLILFVKHLIDKKSLKYMEDAQWIRFLFFPFFAIGVIAVMITKEEMIRNTGLENLFRILAFGLVSMNIVVFYLIRDTARKSAQIHEDGLLKMQTDNQLAFYERIIADTQKQRKMSHEYQNQIECIQTLCETGAYEELKRYLVRINGTIRHDLDRINTNHAIVNAVLNAKYQEAADKGILFVCKINDMSGLQIESQDMVVLLANILNNAIEACERCNGDKYIKFKIVHEHGDLILSEKNSYNGVMRYENGRIETTKTKDRENHGLGIKNIRQVIEKYDGYYSIQNTEKEFYISIIIPQEKNTP